MRLKVVLLLICASQILFAAQANHANSAAGAKHPDVFLVTIDTLRADHVGCFGDKSIRTPAIDSLCRDGLRFANAFTASSITNTAHASILTGLYPSETGVLDFGSPLRPGITTL